MVLHTLDMAVRMNVSQRLFHILHAGVKMEGA
jgi:hypothetical protein